MTEENFKALGIFNYAAGGALVAKLYTLGVITKEDAIEIYDDALLNLETNQTFAGDEQNAVAMARQLMGMAIREISKP